MNHTTRRLLVALATSGLLGLAACGEDPVGTDQPSDSPSETASPTEPSASDSPTDEPSTSDPSPSETDDPDSAAVPVYYLGNTDKAGPRLFREWRPGEADRLTTALGWATQGKPQDPDYYTLWAEGAPLVLAAGVAGDVIEVDLSADAGLDQRPSDMSKRQAEVSVQQLVFTAQGVLQERLPVRFLLGGSPAATIYGVDTSDPVRRASPLSVLNHINITSPEEGATVTGDTLEVVGAGNSFEASGLCELLVGDEVVAAEPWMARGWMADKLFPWKVQLPLGDAGTGEAVVRCRTDDPSGGTEGFGTFVDDKSVTIG